MTDLTEKPCPCGKPALEVIRYEHRKTDGTYHPYRDGWRCTECGWFEKAILRERLIDESC